MNEAEREEEELMRQELNESTVFSGFTKRADVSQSQGRSTLGLHVAKVGQLLVSMSLG